MQKNKKRKQINKVVSGMLVATTALCVAGPSLQTAIVGNVAHAADPDVIVGPKGPTCDKGDN